MLRLVTLAVLAALGFWVVWPAYSGYQISSALKAGDAAALGGKIDFDGVRASLRPAVSVEAAKRLDDAMSRQGAGGAALAADIKAQLLPKIVDGVLVNLVTADNIIRIYREGGAAKDAIGRIVAEQVGKSGGGLGAVLGGLGGSLGGGSGAGAGAGAGALGGLDKLGGLLGGAKKSPVRDVTNEPAPPAPGAAAPAAKPPQAPTGYGLGNIKAFGFEGPLRMRAGVAKDPAATVADVTAELSFTGTDWKLTGLVPRF